MNVPLKYIICFCLIICSPVYGQDGQGDRSKSNQIDIYLGVDVYNYINQYFFDNAKTQSAFVARVSWNNKIFMTGEWGSTSVNRIGVIDTFSYKMSGNYTRFGVAFNLIHSVGDRYAITLGAEYASVNIVSQELSYTETHHIWGTYQRSVKDENIRARWLEFPLQMQMRIIKYLYIGTQLRLAFSTSLPPHDTLVFPTNIRVPELPGYGIINYDPTVTLKFSLSYYLTLRLPIKFSSKS